MAHENSTCVSGRDLTLGSKSPRLMIVSVEQGLREFDKWNRVLAELMSFVLISRLISRVNFHPPE